MFSKLNKNITQHGLIETLKKIITYPFQLYLNQKRQKKKNKFLVLKNNIDRFTEIYKLNYWNNSESVSGSGSTLNSTKKLRSELPTLLKKFQISTVLDAPCGDFNWMNVFLKNNELKKYIGGDIVKEIIKANNELYIDESKTFIEIDLTKDILPECDLMICRDCLIHFSYEDIYNFLKNFNRSSIKYLLTTNYHPNKKIYYENRDIISGDDRLINLMSTPFNFPNSLYSIKEYDLKNFGSIHMDLFSKSQISLLKIPVN